VIATSKPNPQHDARHPGSLVLQPEFVMLRGRARTASTHSQRAGPGREEAYARSAGGNQPRLMSVGAAGLTNPPKPRRH
jgi:hypothetical protein